MAGRPQAITENPPSTGIAVPVTKFDAGHRDARGLAMTGDGCGARTGR
jgi:hypothetical protein